MPIGRPRFVKCKKCKKKFAIMIGDIRPQKIECPNCGFVWLFTDTH